MGFWIFMLIAVLVMPAIMILFGQIFQKNSPRKINDYYGYRTSRSMKNMETWKYAHSYCGKLWWKLGWLLLIAGGMPMFFLYGKDMNTVGIATLVIMVIQFIFLMWSVYLVERELKNKFDDNGNKKY